jgi:hypothetical protein
MSHKPGSKCLHAESVNSYTSALATGTESECPGIGGILDGDEDNSSKTVDSASGVSCPSIIMSTSLRMYI